MEDEFNDDSYNINPSIIVCSECSGIMRYKGAGRYVCEDCKHEVLDDFGKVRQFLEKRGPSNVFEISAGTGIPRSVVNKLLKDGRLQVSPHSEVGLVCSRCGMAIRFGEYCNRCQEEISNIEARNKKKGIYNVFNEEKEDGKMRFLQDDKKK
ncbi:MAG: hypothetical protein J5819_09490 [Eubacterium sp.]|nr:hypothetical protein [Eubacterium sp.]